ncbi:1-acyl-sn-glycerol-3-phosphate acyltransferase, partial [Pseudomonas aeruginosa]|nr:1-acyl-sn-glycerol-3-phosphate acyltransferase [Pseudomonas aeruginosa]
GPRAIAELNQRAEAWVSETMAEISPIQQRVSHPEPSVVS